MACKKIENLQKRIILHHKNTKHPTQSTPKPLLRSPRMMYTHNLRELSISNMVVVDFLALHLYEGGKCGLYEQTEKHQNHQNSRSKHGGQSQQYHILLVFGQLKRHSVSQHIFPRRDSFLIGKLSWNYLSGDCERLGDRKVVKVLGSMDRRTSARPNRADPLCAFRRTYESTWKEDSG